MQKKLNFFKESDTFKNQTIFFKFDLENVCFDYF